MNTRTLFLASCWVAIWLLAVSPTFGQTVTVNDAALKTYLLGLVDTGGGGNSDGAIQVTEAEGFSGAIIYTSSGLSDPTGLEAFTNTTILSLVDNSLTSFDPSPFTKLTQLALGNNSLSTIDVSALTLLEQLFVNGNNLSTLDISSNSNLDRLDAYDNILESITFGTAPYEHIDCRNNSLSGLTLNGLTALDYVAYDNNDLTSFNITNCTVNELALGNNDISSFNLSGSTVVRLELNDNDLSSVELTTSTIEFLYVFNNPGLTYLDITSLSSLSDLRANNTGLTSLDLSSNVALEGIQLNDSPIEFLDLSNQSLLTFFDLSDGNLQSLNIQNGNNSSMTFFDVRNNTDLTCIEVDDVTYSTNNWSLKPSGASYSLVCAPTLLESSISDESVYDNADLEFTLTFSEEVSIDQSSNMFRMYDDIANTYLDLQPVITGVTANSISFSYIPARNNCNYSILIDPSAVEDLAGNAYAGISDLTTLNFSTYWEQPDITKDPAQLETGVPVDQNLTITFDREMVPSYNAGSSYDVRLLKYSGSVVIEDMLLTDSQLTLSTNTLTINPTDDLEYSTVYRVIVSYYLLEDAAFDGHPWDGLTQSGGENSWLFTTEDEPDLTPPSPTTYSPEDNATDVERSVTMELTFDEDIALGSGTIRLGYVGFPGQQFATYTVPSASEVTVDGDKLIINPDSDLPPATEINIEIADGVVEDLEGNAFAGIDDETTWNFTTIDDVAPDAQSLTPFNGSTYGGLNARVNISFSEDMQEGSGTVSLYKSDGTFVEEVTTGVADSRIEFPATFRIVIDFDTDLEELEDYYIVVSNGAFEDLAGNDFAGISEGEWEFTANARPHISSLSPADGATDVAIDTDYTLILDASVWANSDTDLLIKNYDTDALVETISIADVEAGDGIISFSGSDLPYDAHLYIVINDEGQIQSSTNGEAFIGLNDKDEWDFTTVAAPQPPELSAVSPVNNATDVSLSTDFTMTFDMELYVSNDVTLELRNYDTDVLVETIALPGDYVDEDGVITVSPASELENNTHYYVLLGGTGSIESNSSALEYDGLTDKEEWQFTTTKVDQTITFDALVDKTYGDAAIELSATATSGLAVTFSISSGPATLDGTTLTITGAGEVEVAANQSGDETYDAAPQVTQSFTVSKADQEISITEIADKLTTDEAFDVEASVDTELALTYGVSGPASISGTTITLDGSSGTVTVTVSQAGTDNYNAVSAEETFNVSDPAKTDQTITFDELEDKTYGDADFDLSATASSGLSVSYSVVSGPATIDDATVSITGAGEITIAADQEGDASFNAASQVTQSFTVSKADQVISITAIADKTTSDESFEVEATVDSELALSYEVSGPASIEGTTITLEGASGTVTVTVSQAGNDNYNSASAEISFNVNDPAKSDQTITFEDIADKVYGDDDFTLSATASSGLAVSYSVISGPVSIDGSTVSIIGAGEATIAVDQSGDDSFNAASQVTSTFTISKADQTISITSIEDKLTTDGSFDVEATVDSELALNYEVSGPATIDGITISLDGSEGTVTVTVSQEGNENYNSASSQVTFEVEASSKSSQTITFEDITDKVFGDEDFELSASASSGLAVTYTVISGPVSIDESTVTITGTGDVTIAADQSGDDSFNAAPQVTQSFTISKADQSITFEALADMVFGDEAFELSASASSGLSVTYSVISGPASIDESTVTITGAGEVTIGADQSGNENFNAASQVTQSFSVSKADQIITITTIEDKLVSDAAFDVEAETDSELELTYEIDGPASIDGTTITLDGIAGTVTVTVNQVGNDNYNAASETISFEVNEPAGPLNASNGAKVLVYPNPVSEYLFVSGISGEVHVTIIDMNGQEVLNNTYGPKGIAISSLDAGHYLLRIKSKSIITTTSIVIR